MRRFFGTAVFCGRPTHVQCLAGMRGVLGPTEGEGTVAIQLSDWLVDRQPPEFQRGRRIVMPQASDGEWKA
jgi:hypothetical protein